MQPSRTIKPRHHRMDDERLARLAGAGDAAAFEALYDRHHAPLLAFCRHMLGSREDGEDALQQALVRAHTALMGGRAPDRVRPWLYAIARNRCLTMIAARREAAVPADDLEPAFDGLAAEVERRADLRELVADLGRLPDDQRAALVLAELGDLGHGDIARVIGCPPAKVKALVFQARTALIAERDARRTPCDEIRAQLETARAGVLRRGALRKHLRQCDPCAAYRAAVEGQRAGLAILLPVAPTAGLKLAVLAGAGGLGGGAEAAAAAASLAAGGAAAGGGGVAGGAGAGVAGSAGAGVAAGSAGAAGVAASAGAVKALAVKAVVVAALAAGGGEAVREIAHEEPAASAAAVRVEPAVEQAAVRPASSTSSAPIAEPGDAGAIAAGAGGDEPGAADDESGAAGGEPDAADDEPGHDDIGDASSALGDDPPAAAGRRARRVLAAAAAGDLRAVRRVRHRLRAADPAVARRVRRRLIRARLRAGLAPAVGVVLETRRERRRDRVAGDPELAPEPVGTVEPVATATPEPRPRRRRRPRPLPTPVPVPVPAAEPAPAVEPEPAATPAPEPVDESEATGQPG